ncbi:MAG TPA: BON domain-containing protein [Paraburkholderia sp.]|jgi:hyperosmotically inducible protein|nr:BON domain-containing protein [Paraburkholderia sp.]
MNVINKLGCATGVLLLASSIHAWSQTSDAADATVASAPASGVASQKSTKQANRALRKQVYTAIGKVKAIDAGNISVTARSGVVTLNGTVKDASQVGQVADIARGVPGVTSVNNKLSVARPFGGQ